MHSRDDDLAALDAATDAVLARSQQSLDDHVDEILQHRRRSWLKAARLWGFRAWVYQSGIEAKGRVVPLDEMVAALDATGQLAYVPVMYEHNNLSPTPTEYGRLTSWRSDGRRVIVEGVTCVEPRPGEGVSLGSVFIDDVMQWATELSFLPDAIPGAVPGACVMDVWPIDVADIRKFSEGCD